MPRASKATPASEPQAPSALTLIASLTLVVGIVTSAALLGVPALERVSQIWRALLGLAALPIAFGLLGIGGALVRKSESEPWSLPWSRALAAEIALFASLALLAAGFLRGFPFVSVASALELTPLALEFQLAQLVLLPPV